MSYGIRIRKPAKPGKRPGSWKRGVQYRRLPGRRIRWTLWRSKWPTRATAEARLRQYRAAGYVGHVYDLESARDKIVMWCRWALDVEPRVHYLQRRPMRLAAAVAKKLDMWTDCSESTTAAFKSAGAPDPNGNAYDGTGYTGTMRAHLRRISIAAAKPGDLIIYGPGNGDHVVIVMQSDPIDPLVFSHGQESGPRLYRHSVQVAAHRSGYTVHHAGVA